MRNIRKICRRTNWNVKKLFIYSLGDYAGFSVVPLSVASHMGVPLLRIIFLMIVTVIVNCTLIWGDPVAGWLLASKICDPVRCGRCTASVYRNSEGPAKPYLGKGNSPV